MDREGAAATPGGADLGADGAAGLGARTGRALGWRAAQVLGTRLLSLARTLLLARLLVPEQFGLVAVAAVTLELVAGLSDFGLVDAVVQRKQVDRRHYDAAWTVRVLRAAVLAVLLVAAAPLVAAAFDAPDARPLVQVLALRPLLEALGSIGFARLERGLELRRIAAVTLTGVVVETVVAVALATALGAVAVVLGAVAGAATVLVLSYLAAPWRPRPTLAREVTGPLFSFGKWVWAASCASVVGDFLLAAVVSRRLGSAELGVYFLATRLALLPAQSLTTVFVGVTFPLHARLQDDPERGARALRANVVALAALLAPPYAVLVALAGPGTAAVLGPEWARAAPLVPALAGVALLGAVVYAVLPMLDGRGRPEQVAALYGLRALVLAALSWSLAGAYGLGGAAGALLVAEVGIAGGCLVLAGRALPLRPSGLLLPVTAVLAAAGVATLAGLAVAERATGLPGLAGAAAGVLLLATALTALADRLLRLGLLDDLGRVLPAVDRLRRVPRG